MRIHALEIKHCHETRVNSVINPHTHHMYLKEECPPCPFGGHTLAMCIWLRSPSGRLATPVSPATGQKGSTAERDLLGPNKSS